MAYPPVQTCYMRPTSSSHAVPVTAQFTPTPGAPPPRPRGGKPRKRKKSKHARFNPAGPGPGPVLHPAGPRPTPPPHAAHAYQQAPGTHHAAVASEPYYSRPAMTPGDTSGYGSYGGYYYAPSPLTRWEMLGGGAGTPRRHYEYFSGEYRWSYPTPVRQGIYSMATDANRITAIFSDENPNACTIV